MAKKCCIPICKIYSDQPKGRDLSFHKVPTDEKTKIKWEEDLKKRFNLDLKKHFYVCSLHFEPECYSIYSENRSRLNKGSCPTVFLEKINIKEEFEENTLDTLFAHSENKSRLDEGSCSTVFLEHINIKEEFEENTLDTSFAHSENKSRLDEGSCSTVFLEHINIKEEFEENTLDTSFAHIVDNEEDQSNNCHDSCNDRTEVLSKSTVLNTILSSDKINISNLNPNKRDTSFGNMDVKSFTPSILSVEIESLSVSPAIKKMLFRARSQIISLRKKNKTLNMRLYRLEKKFIDNRVTYLAGFVLKEILRKSRCYICPLLLTCDADEKSSGTPTLLNRKNRERSMYACPQVVEICKIIEKNFRLHYKSRKNISAKLLHIILHNIPQNLLLIKHSENPLKHRLILLKEIIKTYLRIRINHHESKKRSSMRKVRSSRKNNVVQK